MTFPSLPNERISAVRAFTNKDKRTNYAAYGGADGTRTRDPRRDRPVF